MDPLRRSGYALRGLVRGAADALASVLFPGPCRACQATLATASRIPLCRECLAALGPLARPICQACGRPLGSPPAGPALLCHACRRALYGFDLARSYGPYTDAMVRAVTLLKYEAVTPLGRWFAARLADLVTAEPAFAEVDLVVPVPLDADRRRERGYNQAELIARPLGRLLGKPLDPALLVRTRPRPEKLKLSRRERWQTVRGAYRALEGARIDKARILLVDDVFTTGATLDACARALRERGASRVLAITVARVTRERVLPATAGLVS
jgi:competence protein ComFC